MDAGRVGQLADDGFRVEVEHGDPIASRDVEPPSLRVDSEIVPAALASDGTLRVVAINNEVSTNVQVRIAPGHAFRSAGTLRMTGPSLDATSGVTYAGATVGADGTWVPGTYSPVYTASGVYAISVPASSIAVVTLVP